MSFRYTDEHGIERERCCDEMRITLAKKVRWSHYPGLDTCVREHHGICTVCGTQSWFPDTKDVCEKGGLLPSTRLIQDDGIFTLKKEDGS